MASQLFINQIINVMGYYTVDHNGSTHVDGRTVQFKRGKEVEGVQKGDLDHIGDSKWHSDHSVSFEDLPYNEILVDAGYDTLKKVQTLSKDELTEIDGIGDKTANKIIAFFE